MEVKIGIVHTARELVLESTATVAEVNTAIDAALAGGTLSLTDEKGRIVIVPGEKIAYVEIAATQERRVGFAG